MRKLKEGDYFAPKNKEEYGFILKSLRELGYNVYDECNVDGYSVFPIILYEYGEFHSCTTKCKDYKTQITLHDLFTEDIETFEPDQKVLVRDSEDEPWRLDIYDSFVPEGDAFPHRCITNSWKYCIDYDTNKEKYGKI